MSIPAVLYTAVDRHRSNSADKAATASVLGQFLPSQAGTVQHQSEAKVANLGNPTGRATHVARFQVSADDASVLGRLQGEAHLLCDVYSSFQRNSVVLGADCSSAISRGQSTKIQPMSRVGLDVSMQLLLEVD